MPYISNLRSIISTQVICSYPGDNVEDCIAIALRIVAQPQTAYAYFDHNGVIVTVDKTSTVESAYQDWQQRLEIMTGTFCANTASTKR